MVNDYVPDAGDIIWVDFSPTIGREQTGKRPAVVLSPRMYNTKSSLVVACPITTKIKGYPFEVGIRVGKIDGVVLADQIKSFDWRQRKTTKDKATVPAVTMQEIKEAINALINPYTT